MRTLAVATGPRIPRIAVVRGGVIRDEHLVRDASSVTVGTSEHARIVVRDAPSLPPSFELLERVGDRYWLRFTEAMSGRVSGPNGIVALSDLRSTAHAVRGAYRVLLGEDARGKVIVGDTTFLFQIVPAPPPASRPQLPVSVKNGLSLDWNLTIIAAFSFLLHFAIAGATYSDWMDPVVSSDHTVAGLIDDLARLPKPPPESIVDSQTPATENSPNVATPSAAPTSPREAQPAPHSRPSHHTAPAAPSVTDDDAAKLAARAAALEVGFITSKAQGPAVKGVLDGRNVPVVDLTKAAERNAATTHEHDELKVASGGPAATGTSSLSTIGGPTHRNGQDKAGIENPTTGPSINVTTLPPVTSTPLPDAERVIATLRPRFRKCYQDGLNADPTMGGKTTVVAKVGPNGEVISADIGSTQGLSPTVTSCLARVVSNATFTGNRALTTLNVPITLMSQR